MIMKLLDSRLKSISNAMMGILILIAFSGCDSNSNSGFNPQWVLDEHGNPDFKPDHFHDAIEKLKDDFGLIVLTPPEQRADRVQIFQQIVRWLPEYAADTDIDRQSWEKLNAVSRSFLESTKESDFFTGPRRVSVNNLLDELLAMIPVDPNQQKIQLKHK